VSYLSCLSPVGLILLGSTPKLVYVLGGLRTALGTSTTQAQAIQTAYSSSQ
jgi:flagellar biosynthesis protein FliP